MPLAAPCRFWEVLRSPAAQLIKFDSGLRVAAVDYGFWDTHEGQGLPQPGVANHYDAYGNLLQHFTGSKAHNVALREAAQQRLPPSARRSGPVLTSWSGWAAHCSPRSRPASSGGGAALAARHRQ